MFKYEVTKDGKVTCNLELSVEEITRIFAKQIVENNSDVSTVESNIKVVKRFQDELIESVHQTDVLLEVCRNRLEKLKEDRKLI